MYIPTKSYKLYKTDLSLKSLTKKAVLDVMTAFFIPVNIGLILLGHAKYGNKLLLMI